MNFLTDSVSKISELTTLGIVENDRPVLAFDTHKKQLIYTFICRTNDNKEYIIELRISVKDMYRLERVIVYAPQEKEEAPIIVEPITVTSIAGEEFNIPIEDLMQNINVANSEPFVCSTTHFEMLDKLKVAEEKGCF